MKHWKKPTNNFETLFAISGVADCDNLLALFGPRFDDNASDIVYIIQTGCAVTFSNAGCETSDLFLKAVERLYEMEPSYNSAYYLYRLYSARETMKMQPNTWNVPLSPIPLTV